MDNGKVYPQRTPRQSRALHVLFDLLAKNLNEHGLDQRKVLKESVDIPWSKDSIKAQIWRPVQKAQLNKNSTTELTTKEIDEVFDTIIKHLGQKFGISQDFPSIDTVLQNIEAERR